MIIIIILIIIIFILISYDNIETYQLSLPEVMRLYPTIGKFNSKYLLSSNKIANYQLCQLLCNRLKNCEGISYKRYPYSICNTYSNTSMHDKDPFYLSWKKIWTH